MAAQFGRGHRLLIGAVVAVAALPAIGSILRWGGLPPGMDVFPASHAGLPKPGFSWLVFSLGALAAAVILAFLASPTLFGFKLRGTRKRHLHDGRLPWWFWFGLGLNLASWTAHWWGPVSVALFSFLPLWWGWIMAIDGVVYARTNGRSMLATETRRTVVIALVSIPAWAFFEVLNYFAVEFWGYPNTQLLPPLPHALWHLVSFSVVLPAIFEWYTLLHTFDGLWNRWSKGPAAAVPRRLLGAVLIAGGASLFLFGLFPFQLFPLLWVGPPLVLTAALAILGFWTPFRPIRGGNWTPVVIAAVASFLTGVTYELWNHGSAFFHGSVVTNPNYWFYDIPYVDRFRPFSEMPLLGYFGYLPFGFLAWVCWLVAAHILDIQPSFDLTPCNSSDGHPDGSHDRSPRARAWTPPSGDQPPPPSATYP